MRWLIDGYNVIRREPDLRAREAESLEAGRRALLHLLARAHRDPRDEFTVVFDGARVAGGGPSHGRIRTIFSRPPHTADDELIRLARQWQSGRSSSAPTAGSRTPPAEPGRRLSPLSSFWML